MLEFVKRELEFKFDDEVYKIKFPTVKEMSEYSKTYDEKEDKFEVIVNFLEKLGLQRDITEQMEVKHLTTIVKALTEEKK